MTREQVEAWRDAAVADGWTIKPTYRHESVETAATLERGGWVAMIFMRPTQKEPTIDVWGADRLTVRAPWTYDWQALQQLLRTCLHCGAKDIATRRVGFAGRVCEPCLPEQRKLIEVRGWAD